MKKQVLLSLALIISTTYLTLNAQNWNEIIKATASDATFSDQFGYSVSIDGNYAIVGAAYDNTDFGTDTGSAYIFVRSGANWIEQTKLIASDAAADDRFGYSVSINGDYAIVGAPVNDDNGSFSGSTYVFIRSGSSWTEQAKLIASDATSFDQFGNSVSIDGDYAIVGAFGNDDDGSASGSAYIFMRSGSNWTEQTKLTASDADADDWFGYSVSVDDNYVIVGASHNDDGGSNSGSAYVFMRSGAIWTEQAKLSASADSNDLFGDSVGIDGDYAIVGAFGNDSTISNTGSAFIFMRSGTNWTMQAELTASDAAASDFFGRSVAIDGEAVLIGATLNDDLGNESGSAYLFTRSGAIWTEQAKLTASDGLANDRFGSSVAINGGNLIVASRSNSNNAGAAYFYEYDAIITDVAILSDITAECEATPATPTANSGAISATADFAFPITTQGTTVVTWTYDDGNGNTESQTQNIILQDVTAPIVSCANQTINLNASTCDDEMIIISPTLNENCSASNTALDFDGNNDRVIIPTNSSLNFTTEFSVQAWIYPRANRYTRIFTRYSGSASVAGEIVFDTYDGSNPPYLANGRGLRLVFTGTGGGGVFSSNVLSLNTWNHVAGTYNNGVIKLYVNGVEINSSTTVFTSIPASSLDYAIGEDVNVGAYEFFNGQIDELSIWNTALKSTEINNGYNKLLKGTEPGLVAYYNFEEDPLSSILTDKSSNGNNGVLTSMDVNTDWVTSTAPITSVVLTNDITGTSDASGIYPPGDTTITWTAEDTHGNSESCTQIITVTGNDTSLSSLSGDNLILSPAFDSNIYSYTSNVCSNTNNTLVSAITNDENATVIGTGNVNLNIGENNIIVSVENACGEPTDYTIVVSRSTTESEVSLWNGSLSSDWNEPNNWTPNVVPSKCSVVTIPITSNIPIVSGVVEIAKLNLNSGANMVVPITTTLNITDDLTMYSQSDSYSGLVVKGSISVAGNTSYHRYVNSNILGNDLISPPLSSQTWSSFLSPENATALLDNGELPTVYAFAPFDKTTGDYENYNENTIVDLISGKGYRVATDSGEALIFTGTIPNAVNINILDSGPYFTKWNLVGNPYPSYINVHSFLNHEVDLGVSNIDLFANASAAIYGYNASTENKWTIYNLANTNSSTLIAPGQGFYVAADANHVTAYNLEFTKDMQTTGTNDDFILGRNTELIYLKLALSSSTSTFSTEFYFNNYASQGLDKGYDAELWGTAITGFKIYSHLVEDNVGKTIALQSLNMSDLAEISIPVGVNANQGEQIHFSIAETTLPDSVKVYLDDALLNTSTLLNNGAYSIVPTTNIFGTGRFFLRTTEESLSLAEIELDELKVYFIKDFSSLIIEGKLANNTEVDIYDLQGRKVLTMPLDSDKLENRINLSLFTTGVYMVKIRSKSQQKLYKIIIHND